MFHSKVDQQHEYADLLALHKESKVNSRLAYMYRNALLHITEQVDTVIETSKSKSDLAEYVQVLTLFKEKLAKYKQTYKSFLEFMYNDENSKGDFYFGPGTFYQIQGYPKAIWIPLPLNAAGNDKNVANELEGDISIHAMEKLKQRILDNTVTNEVHVANLAREILTYTDDTFKNATIELLRKLDIGENITAHKKKKKTMFTTQLTKLRELISKTTNAEKDILIQAIDGVVAFINSQEQMGIEDEPDTDIPESELALVRVGSYEDDSYDSDDDGGDNGRDRKSNLKKTADPTTSLEKTDEQSIQRKLPRFGRSRGSSSQT
jgi:hypothetical protein